MRDLPAIPPELTIYTVTELRSRYLIEIGSTALEHDLRLDGSSVDSVDAAGIQLLVSLARTVAAQGRSLRVVEASAPLAGACTSLGVGSLLCTLEPEGAAT